MAFLCKKISVPGSNLVRYFFYNYFSVGLRTLSSSRTESEGTFSVHTIITCGMYSYTTSQLASASVWADPDYYGLQEVQTSNMRLY